MPVNKFEATEGLLHDDMRKQAGRIEKSWLEAAMNAVDAGATEFRVNISKDVTELIDDGSGMNEDEIGTYFQKFGYKDDDVEEKTYGKFRRGRGQIFNFGINVWHTQDNLLVVNLDDDETEVEAPVDSDKGDDDVHWNEAEMPVFNTEGLGFNQQKAIEYYDGTHITVKHYKELDDVDEKVAEFKKLVRYISWMHDIDIYVNEDKVESNFDADFETEYAWFNYGSPTFFPDAAVYNLGAYVSDINVKDSDGDRIPVSGIIITKKELDLNNARTEIIEGDEVWEQVVEDYEIGARYTLAKRNDMEKKEKQWLIKQSRKDDDLFDLIKDRELIEDINGEELAITDLQDKQVGFAPSGNALAREAMDRSGTLMVDESYKDSLTQLAQEGGEDKQVPEGKSYEQVIDDDLGFEMKERSISKLSKRRRENLMKVKWLLREIGCYDDVKPGYSKHEDVWRPDDVTIMVDEDFLNSNKMKFATEVVDKVVEIAAADCDTRGGFDKSNSYRRSYYRMMNKTTEPRKKLLEGNEDLTSVPQLE